ncbi:histidine kinase dimerization/phospho-acceptor domain-containing protein [Nocardioides jejuensis]|uniref:histidine kinase n=1 Tax=Nocardioides jejuensis TaxID=2502782 RepID=A0A4R1CGT4_9ACTN|nr:histidine kinase dimerization/phospho-acceptor domain-containing protein [Nocardioides jejuensis]TCJ30440.1 hypothetical protein EPD65_04375 [Nocardioides jejuensis]
MASSDTKRIAELESRLTAMHQAHEQLAHDLRNPLAGLMASLELLGSEPAVLDDAEVAALVANARHATGRLDELIGRLLG